MFDLRTAIAMSTVGFALFGTVVAQTSEPPSGTSRTTPPADSAQRTGAGEMNEGEIRKVDKENKKITIKHGPLKSLDMPGMTMVFNVKDEAVLDKVKTGEKVRFQAEKIEGKFVVTTIHAAP